MSRLKTLALAASFLVPAAAALAADDGLMNGPDGTLPNTPGSALGFSGINAVAPERELLYHPDENNGAAAAIRAEPDPRSDPAPMVHRPARHHRRRVAQR